MVPARGVGRGAPSPRNTTCRKRKHPLSYGHAGPQDELHSLGNGLSSLQGQLEWVRWRLSCGGPRGLLPEWEGGLLKGRRRREGLGLGADKWEALCIMCVNIGALRPAHSQTDCPSHPTPTSLAAPRFLLMCAPQGHAVGCCGFSAARPRPLRQHGGDKELRRLAPARPQGATGLSHGGRRKSPIKRWVIHFC